MRLSLKTVENSTADFGTIINYAGGYTGSLSGPLNKEIVRFLLRLAEKNSHHYTLDYCDLAVFWGNEVNDDFESRRCLELAEKLAPSGDEESWTSLAKCYKLINDSEKDIARSMKKAGRLSKYSYQFLNLSTFSIKELDNKKLFNEYLELAIAKANSTSDWIKIIEFFNFQKIENDNLSEYYQKAFNVARKSEEFLNLAKLAFLSKNDLELSKYYLKTAISFSDELNDTLRIAEFCLATLNDRRYAVEIVEDFTISFTKNWQYAPIEDANFYQFTRLVNFWNDELSNINRAKELLSIITPTQLSFKSLSYYLSELHKLFSSQEILELVSILEEKAVQESRLFEFFKVLFVDLKLKEHSKTILQRVTAQVEENFKLYNYPSFLLLAKSFYDIEDSKSCEKMITNAISSIDEPTIEFWSDLSDFYSVREKIGNNKEQTISCLLKAEELANEFEDYDKIYGQWANRSESELINFIRRAESKAKNTEHWLILSIWWRELNINNSIFCMNHAIKFATSAEDFSLIVYSIYRNTRDFKEIMKYLDKGLKKCNTYKDFHAILKCSVSTIQHEYSKINGYIKNCLGSIDTFEQWQELIAIIQQHRLNKFNKKLIYEKGVSLAQSKLQILKVKQAYENYLN